MERRKKVKLLFSQVRRLLGDFGVPIAIFLMVVADISIEDVYTQVGSFNLLCLSHQRINETLHTQSKGGSKFIKMFSTDLYGLQLVDCIAPILSTQNLTPDTAVNMVAS